MIRQPHESKGEEQLEALSSFVGLAEEIGIDYALVGTAALGAYARGSLLDDRPIEIAMYPEAYECLLESFVRLHDDRWVLRDGETHAKDHFTYAAIYSSGEEIAPRIVLWRLAVRSAQPRETSNVREYVRFPTDGLGRTSAELPGDSLRGTRTLNLATVDVRVPERLEWYLERRFGLDCYWRCGHTTRAHERPVPSDSEARALGDARDFTADYLAQEDIHDALAKAFGYFAGECHRLDLPFFLIGGSALGAVRDGGIIPWDDDVDVALYRADYERLLAEFRDSDRYHLRSFGRTEGYLYPWAKVSVAGTIALSNANYNPGIGIFIDVYPIDDVKTGKFHPLAFQLPTKFWRAAWWFDPTIPENRSRPWPIRCLRALLRQLFRGIPNRQAVAHVERAMRSGKVTGVAANIWGEAGIKEPVPKEWFGEGKKIEFLGQECLVPAMADEFLTHFYGDWRVPRNTGMLHGLFARIYNGCEL